MIKCPSCGEDNPPKFRLCGYCGAALGSVAALPAHEVRKTVTLIFSDLKDSTALGERLDSEALHEVKERYFNAMAAEIKRHGGKIEKYIGDAIMAVFGLPRAHEDDALRAVRAAIGMQSVLRGVNDSLKERFGVVLANRTGVNTGEVVAIDDPSADQKLATGDAVNVTARLEQAAPANEIYIGEVTYRLVRDAVEAEPVEPLMLKGKSQPVAVYRLISARGLEGNVRRQDTPVVGRDDELAVLWSVWETVLSRRRAQMVTVIGDAGIGKSRLVRELMDRVGTDVRIICGRCLAYGEGITFWPLREMAILAADIRTEDTPEVAREKLLACTGDADVADRMASAAGLSSTSYPLHEIYWGARRFIQVLAAEKPVVVLFDDIHWAERALLELVENLLETIDCSQVLVLTTARHDLLEQRPQWGEREHSSRLVLRPLGDTAAAQVVTNLLGTAGLPEALMKRIVDAAEGNPLYVEQMLAMLIDTGAVRQEAGRWVGAQTNVHIAIPPTIQALLEARLDNLHRNERAAAEPASVIGLEFPQPAVEALAPAPLRSDIGAQLTELSRKHFIRPATSTESDVRYRFDHHLVRDTVYNGLLKRARATMHTEFVRWADEVNAESDRGQEFEAILGYHLEQAYRYLGELGPIDEAAAAIGGDGARRLASAARRAFARGDLHASANLFERAIGLLPDGDLQRAELLPELGETLVGLGDFVGARTVLASARSLADQIGNQRIKASAQLLEMLIRLLTGHRAEGAEVLPAPCDLIPMLERENAHSELATAWRLIVMNHGIAGKYQLAREGAERSVAHARLAGKDRLVARVGGYLADFALLGPTPVPQAIATCEQLIAEGLSDRQVECKVMCILAQLKAMNGELEAARELYRRGRATLRELGQGVLAATTGLNVARAEMQSGDLAYAEQEVRADLEFLTAKGETYYQSTMAALLARLVREQGHDEEALALSRIAEEVTAADDIESQSLWRAIRAPIIARAGNFEQAEALARTAVELIGATEAPVLHAEALSELATVLALSGKLEEATQTIDRALGLYTAKGNTVFASRCRAWADGLKHSTKDISAAT